MKKQLLIVDDNNALREALKIVFEDDFDLTFASNGEEALMQYSKRSPAVVLMDYKMPGMDGIETLQRMRAQAPDSRVVLMSAYDELSTVVNAMRSGAVDFVGKPFSVEQIKAAVGQTVASAPTASAKSDKIWKENPVPSNRCSGISQNEVDDLIRQTLRIACA